MPTLPLHPSLPSASSATATSSPAFVETAEYSRFVEFSDACRQYRYIGLCFGPPGVGKSLSALRYSRSEMIVPLDRWSAEAQDQKPIDTVLYTPDVVNSPSGVDSGIRRAREMLSSIVTRAVRTEARSTLDRLRVRDDTWRRERRDDPGFDSSHVPPLEPTYMEAFEEFEARTKAVPDPTTLIVVDEADRLRMSSLEQLRSIFDGSGIGMVLIGMPGIEKRLARYPQFYSRIGFVHEYRPLGTPEIEALLAARRVPPGVSLPPEALTEDIISRIAAMTQGNFRLLNRLLTQLQRVLDLNDTGKVSVAILEAARESLVIGQA